MGLKIQYNNVAIILVMTAVLSACGGGGDEGTSNPTPRALMTIDSSNAESTTVTAFNGADSQKSTGITINSGNSVSNSVITKSANNILQNFQSFKNSKKAIASGATTTETIDCNGGGTITFTETSYSYDNCRNNNLDGSYDIFNGSMVLSNLQQSGDDLSCTSIFTATVAYNSLSVREYNDVGALINNTSINGGMSFSSSQSMVNAVCTTTSSINSNYMSIQDNDFYLSFFDYNNSGTTDTNLNYTYNYNVTLDTSVLPGSLKIETISTLQGVETDPFPSSGHLRLTANSTTPGVPSIIDVVFDNGMVTLTVDVDGTPGTDAGYPKTMTWNEFQTL